MLNTIVKCVSKNIKAKMNGNMTFLCFKRNCSKGMLTCKQMLCNIKIVTSCQKCYGTKGKQG